MELVYRQKYIDQIKPFINKPIIKIITGMRRVGKSSLLEIIKQDLLREVKPEQFIHINFESLEYFDLINASQLASYLTQQINTKKGKLYFFFDEIQLVQDWERVINGLRVDLDCDIYITDLIQAYYRVNSQPF